MPTFSQLTGESLLRIATFAALFVLFAAWELLRPCRRLNTRKSLRWFANLSLTTINTVILTLAMPVLPLGMAAIARDQAWGLFNNLALPYAAAFVLSILALDFIVYLQHRIFHHVPILWRLHRVHHSDLDLDVSSGLRFHALEIFVSLLIKLSAVVLLGPPVLAVLVFEILLNGTAMFNHANINLPPRVDRLLRLVLVTPDMHRVHHSIVRGETNSNFGFNMPWWDYLCGTYRAQPAAGHTGMTIGIEVFRDAKDQRLHRLLVQPFLTPRQESAIPESRLEGETAEPFTPR